MRCVVEVEASWGRLLVLLVLLLVCAGCSSRQATPVASFTPEMMGPPLSEGERAALARNKGRIASSVPSSADPLVEQQARYFLHGGRRTMEIVSKRAELYLDYSRQVFRSRNMPEELAYLVIVESGFRMNARSRAGAAGPWQFMPTTGSRFGLRQDAWHDERHDFFRSTVAAAEYLQKLYEQFNDWPTAIAAYNAGEGKMSRACKAAGERTFFGVLEKNDRLDEKTRLREETKQYVPRFLAVTAIMNNLGALGFEPISPRPASRVTRVTVAPGTNLQAMARACDMSWTDFQRFNAHYRKTVSHASSSTNAYVPSTVADRAVAFARNPVRSSGTMVASAQKSGSRSRVQPVATGSRRYTLRPGDTLYSVARAHNTSVSTLLALNSLSNPNAVAAGQTLSVPGKGGVARVAEKGGASATRSYQVQAKDNLWQISRKLNVSVEDLKRWNNLKNQNLQVGQTLVVLR